MSDGPYQAAPGDLVAVTAPGSWKGLAGRVVSVRPEFSPESVRVLGFDGRAWFFEPGDLALLVPTASFEGAVLDVGPESFFAELADLSCDEYSVAEFALNTLLPGDRALCAPGALFFWFVVPGFTTAPEFRRA